MPSLSLIARTLGTAALAAALPLPTALADSPSSLRVMGIVGVDKQHYVAMVETPDGQKLSLRRGDAYGQDTVANITERCLYLRAPGGTETDWCLSGDGQKPSAPAKQASSQAKPGNTPPKPAASTGWKGLVQVDTKMMDELDFAAARLTGDSRENLTEILRARLNLQDLPENFNIRAINGTPVSSAQQGMENLRQSLSANANTGNNIVRISAVNPNGNEIGIYLTRARNQ